MMPESEGAIRTWVRAQPTVMAIVPPERVYFSMPEQDTPTLPLIVFSRQGGSRDIFMDSPRIVFECWGRNKNEASDLAKVLGEAITQSTLNPPIAVDDGEVVDGLVNQILPRLGASWGKQYEVEASFCIVPK